MAKEDVWSKYNIPAIPAERVIRHLYNPMTETWHTDETIVKMEAQTFTHGAMQHCYRLKKWPSHIRHVPIIDFIFMDGHAVAIMSPKPMSYLTLTVPNND